MLPKHRIPPRPGEILLQEYLEPLGITQVAFAKRLGVPVQRINELVRGKRGVTAETAWLLADALKTSPQFWMGLQSDYDLVRVRLLEKAAATRPGARVLDAHPAVREYLMVAEPRTAYGTAGRAPRPRGRRRTRRSRPPRKARKKA